MNKRIAIVIACLLAGLGYFLYEMYPFAKGVELDADKNRAFFKNGRWIHEQDSLAGIEIKDHKMIFFYKGEETLEDDIYDITFLRQISQFSDSSSRLEDVIELTNQQDTLRFEVMGYSDTILSLLYLGSGKFHVYVPENSN